MRYALTYVAGAILGWFLVALVMMLAVGIAHHEWWKVIPPMSFSAALAITVCPVILTLANALLRAVTAR